MRIHKRKVAMIGIAVVMIASLGGCGASEGSDKNNVTPGAESVTTSGQAVSEAAAEEDTRVAELEQVPPPEEYFCKQDVGDFTVYIYSGDAKKVVENISPLDGMYEGEYYIDVYQGNERRDSALYEIMGNRTNYFYKGFESSWRNLRVSRQNQHNVALKPISATTSKQSHPNHSFVACHRTKLVNVGSGNCGHCRQTSSCSAERNCRSKKRL